MVQNDDMTWTGLDGVNNWEFVNDALYNPAWYSLKGGEFKEAVSRMFAPGYLRTWSQFATVARDSNDNVSFMSLEYIHNNVHVCYTPSFLPLPTTFYLFDADNIADMILLE